MNLPTRCAYLGSVVTSSVSSCGSTPIRHDAPMATWATRVPAIPRERENDADGVHPVAVERGDGTHDVGEREHWGQREEDQREHEQHAARPVGRAGPAADAVKSARARAPNLQPCPPAERQRHEHDVQGESQLSRLRAAGEAR